ncbi:uncharacterized protein ATNIH1004_006290 [Aspergillus tanneri]|uniref:Uncharacterized protein n=1 Tax=Aspergillus tanneri TaxID=1220188 RepID=A0A5M9MNR7_9EURO|nr:uncharacterized protein ATNIH1004_006290 [Aspergillus tanneri]KAA8647596.1 hypothetical protein ATNIH1004_006290 [Aspergillus tanneri]
MARKGGSWTKVVLFISLYVSLLESLIEWALILYLYGHRQVDSKMTPSLILALIASFLTVPLVVLHSILAWQYNRVCGFGSQKAILNTACTYLLRLTIIVWLAASVAGLVVVSQKVSCLPDTTDINNNNSFWKVGVSCALHRAVVIVSVLAFVTVCLYFCSRELSPRPYDVSLWGFYICGYHEGRKGSTIRSSSTLSDTRKSDLFFGRVNEEKAWPIQPTPIHPRPHLSRSLDSDPTHDDDILSGSTISPNGTLSRRSPGRTSHEMEIASISLSRPLTDARIYDPYLQWPTQTTPIELPDDRDPPSTHTRQRSKSSSSSSSSSLRRFFPKSFPLSLPLSADPQIRALSNPLRDVGKQALESRNLHPSNTNTNNVEEPDRAEQCRRLPRSITTNSADAPEVIPQPSNTCTAPIQTPIQTPIRTPIQTVYHHPLMQHPLNREPSHRGSVEDESKSNRPLGLPRRQSIHGDRGPIVPYFSSSSQSHPAYPRYTRSRSQHIPSTARWGLRGRGEQELYPRRMWSQRRIDQDGLLYQYQHQHPRTRTRRSRSSTYGAGMGYLDCIRESGTSVDEARGVWC